jgi:hypothetical protein
MPLRRASAIAVLCVLASAATAYAECAWVLWGGVSTSNLPPVLSRHAAYERRDQCFREARSLVGDGHDTTVLKNGYGWTEVFESGTIAEYQCWPDTVDPRGPKGR